MAYGLKYTLKCKSKLNGNAYTLKLSFADYAGAEVDRNMPADSPLVLRKDRRQGSPFRGTSLEFGIREMVDFELDEFYTNKYKNILAQLYVDNTTLIWAGYVATRQLQADYITAPLSVYFTATDGLGLLENYDFTLTGLKSQLEIIMHCIDKLGLGLGYSIAVNLFETSHAENRSPLAQTYEDCDAYEKKSCHAVLGEILGKYNAEITQANARWHITCSTDKKSTRMLYTSAGVYDTTEAAPSVLALGYPDTADVYPVGKLTRSMESGGKKVTISHDYGRKKSFLSNYDFSKYADSAFTDWTTVGSHTPGQRVKDGKYYAFLAGRATLNSDCIQQEIEVTNVSGEAFVFEIDFSAMGFTTSTLTNGLANINMTVRMVVALTDGVNTYYLTKNGWSETLETISESVTASITAPVWNKLKIITDELPVSGTLQVNLYRYYNATPHGGDTYTGVAFSEPLVYFLTSTDELYPSGTEMVCSFDNSTEVDELEGIAVLVADSPDLTNKALLYKRITKASDGTPTMPLWHRLGSALEYSFVVQLARILASESRIARQKLNGTLRGTSLAMNSIISHAYNGNREFEIAECSWDLYEETWSATLLELLAWTNEAITFTTTSLNEGTQSTLNPDGTVSTNDGGMNVEMSAAQILAKLKTVDGTGSGLDADTVDNIHGTDLAPKADPVFTGVVTTGSHHRKVISVGASGSAGAQVNYLRLQPSNVGNIIAVRVTIKGTWSNSALQGFLTGEYAGYAQADGNFTNKDFRITSTTGLVWSCARLSDVVVENGYYSIGVYINGSNPVEIDVEWWDSANIIKDNLTMSGWAGASLPAANFQSIQGELRVTGDVVAGAT